MSNQILQSKFIIDSNSFIDPFRRYYSMSHFPSYWSWLEACLTGATKEIVIPQVVYDELAGSGDQLSQWVENLIKPVVFKGYETDPNYIAQYSRIMNYLQTCRYYDTSSIAEWSKDSKADPKLIAIAATYNWQIITFEQKAGYLNINNPSKKEPKIPDVASAMGVSCVSLFQVEDSLKLSI